MNTSQFFLQTISVIVVMLVMATTTDFAESDATVSKDTTEMVAKVAMSKPLTIELRTVPTELDPGQIWVLTTHGTVFPCDTLIYRNKDFTLHRTGQPVSSLLTLPMSEIRSVLLKPPVSPKLGQKWQTDRLAIPEVSQQPPLELSPLPSRTATLFPSTPADILHFTNRDTLQGHFVSMTDTTILWQMERSFRVIPISRHLVREIVLSAKTPPPLTEIQE